MSNTWFEFKQFTVHQDQCAFKVTTDSCLLAASVKAPGDPRICDIGTGTGVIALMLAQKFQRSSIHAVEIDTLSARQAGENVRRSPWNDKIDVYNQSIQQFSNHNKSTFDLVISNPPYYEDHLMSPDLRKNLARHNFKITRKELALAINTILNPQGQFYIILPPFAHDEMALELKTYGFILNRKLEIFTHPGKPLYRIIGCFSRKITPFETERLFIYAERDDYSVAFKTLLKDYYLAF